MIQSRHDAAGMSSEATMMMTPLNHQKPGVAEVFFPLVYPPFGESTGDLASFLRPRNSKELSPYMGN